MSSISANNISCNIITASGGIYAPGGVSTGDLYVDRVTSTDFISASQLFVSSVNGAAYPPLVAVPADLVVSTLTAATSVSTSQMFVSSVIGVSFNAVNNVTTSTLTTSSITGTSADINADVNTTKLIIKSGQQNPGIHLPGQSSAPGISADIYFSQGTQPNSTIGLHLASITPSSQALITEYYPSAFFSGGLGIGNFAMDTLFLSRSGTWANLRADAAGTSIQSSVPISVSSLINVSSVNGAAYPPAASVSPNLIVSTLTAATSVSTQALSISSINGGVYPPPSASSPNGEFSTMVVSSFINTLAVNTSSITANEMIVSSIQFGEAVLSTCCFISNTGGASADLQINLGVTGSTGPGTLRVYNNASFGGGGIIDVEQAIGVSTITGRPGADINLEHAVGRSISIYNVNTTNFGTLQVGTITQISSISGLDASFITTATSTLSVSTINGAPVVSLPYTLSGTTANATITNRGTGAANDLTQNVFTSISQITFNIPTDWSPTDSVYYDGWILSDFNANFNSFWGVSYFTNTNPTPTDLIGSTSVTANALNYSNIQQIYLTTNLIIPPTYLASGGKITLTIYCNPTSANHYLTIAPVNQARIGLVKD